MQTTSRFSRRFLPLVVGVLLLVLTAGFVWWWAASHYGSAALVKHHFVDPDFSSVQAGSTASTRITNAFSAYEGGQFSQAVELLITVSPSDGPAYGKAQILLGYTYLRQQKYNEAQEVAQTLLALRNGKVRYEAEWLMVMSHLGLKQQALAREELRLLQSDSTHTLSAKQEALLRDLEHPLAQLNLP
ncbi:MAG: hypothetical protein H6555_10345 [Lewinellaceae bacterium]|nr:hypothetical protein [Lewinellaceae bacterium]